MMKLVSFVWVALFLVAVSDAAMTRTRRTQKSNSVDSDLTGSIDMSAMNRIKQRYLRAEQNLNQNQNHRFMMADSTRLGKPTRKERDFSLPVDEEPLSMSLSMSMPEISIDVQKIRSQELELSMSLSMSMEL